MGLGLGLWPIFTRLLALTRLLLLSPLDLFDQLGPGCYPVCPSCTQGSASGPRTALANPPVSSAAQGVPEWLTAGGPKNLPHAVATDVATTAGATLQEPWGRAAAQDVPRGSAQHDASCAAAGPGSIRTGLFHGMRLEPEAADTGSSAGSASRTSA